MATIHNVSILTASNYFTTSTAALPMEMFSEKELTGKGSSEQGRIRNDGFYGNITNGYGKRELQMTKSDIYNALPRMNDDLETVRNWDYTDKNMSISNIDEHQEYKTPLIKKTNGASFEYENPFKIPLDSLTYVNRYQYVYKESLVAAIHTYEMAASGNQKSGYMSTYVVNMPVAPSLFNPFLGINAFGPMENVPLINRETEDEDDGISIEIDQWKPNSNDTDGTNQMVTDENNKTYKIGKHENVSDCSIKTLVELSKPVKDGKTYKSSKLGMARYKWADFMYCKDLGKYSNNMLITLRKFPHPIGDNIFSRFGFGETEDSEEMDMAPDIGRMVAWLGNENKLEDIIKFQTRETWRELDAEDEEQQGQGDSTPLGALFSLGNPQYMQAVARGTAGTGNGILGMFAGRQGGFLSNKAQYEFNPAMNGSHYDTHKVYTPKGTVQKTHIYEGKLEFTHSFRLVFDYELRAYENINPKAAFLDLLGNVLSTCYRKGTFWGGAHRLIGAPGNGMASGWKMANEFIDGIAETGGGLLTGLLSGGKQGTSVKDAGAKIREAGGDLIDMAKQAWKSLSSGGAIKIGQIFSQGLSGMLKNGLGRPQVYAFHALLSGEPVGLWHVTIGNPRNPILAMGNLIIDSTDYQFYGPLGIDDFPTGFKVTVNLKHAKPRDAAEIANMFTKGQTTINLNLIGGTSKNAFSDFVDENDEEYNSNMYGTIDRNKLLNAMTSASS